MAELGGLLASDILKVVCQRIGLVIGDRIKLQANFIHDLEGMKMTLESVAALLNDAERRSIEEETVRLWLKRLKHWQSLTSNFGRMRGCHPFATAMNSSCFTIHAVEIFIGQGPPGPNEAPPLGSRMQCMASTTWWMRLKPAPNRLHPRHVYLILYTRSYTL